MWMSLRAPYESHLLADLAQFARRPPLFSVWCGTVRQLADGVEAALNVSRTKNRALDPPRGFERQVAFALHEAEFPAHVLPQVV
jgi:hypothetical protein